MSKDFAGGPDEAAAPPDGRRTAFWLGIALFLAYWANGRTIGAGDTIPAQLLPIALIRGDKPYLDRFERMVVIDAAGHPNYYATLS
ncbi:MAG TPA: hypothetical protein VKP69_32655, partial [Isosphaeraceae bacterium]|nr:hypothetical protein [Isosphaeraceae bacterium]